MRTHGANTCSPLFSGHRLPWTFGDDVQRLALDVSSILVLGWLNLLPNVLKAFKTLTLPATVLTELFEGRRRVQQVQKSRIQRARELEQALRRSSIKIARPIERTNDPLSVEIGPSLAAFDSICGSRWNSSAPSPNTSARFRADSGRHYEHRPLSIRYACTLEGSCGPRSDQRNRRRNRKRVFCAPRSRDSRLYASRS